MALVIRLRQQGAKNKQTYRLVLTEKRNPRDGKYLEKLGWYDPFQEGEKQAFVDQERILFWLSQGAQISEKAKSLVKRLAPNAFVKKARVKKAKKASSQEPKKKAAPKKAAKKVSKKA